MSMHPAAPALWIAAVLTLAVTIVGHVFNLLDFDPVLSLLFYFLFMELSKFIAEITNDGSNND
jgi:hypothetical protein